MHHRRNRKPRREAQRLDHHKARQAERHALNGGRPATVRGEHYSTRMPQPPIPDRPSNGKRSKKSKKIAYCPGRKGNKRHEYLTDTEVDEYPRWYWMGWRQDGYTSIRTFKLCVHCGKERTVRYEYPNS